MGMTIDDSREGTPMSREEVVETLKTMVFGVQAFERFNAKEREALDYAISSLKTDEAYQIMYEGGEIFTKADMVAMFTDIRDEIASNYLIDIDTGKIISGTLLNFKAQKLLDRINNELDKLKENTDVC